MQRSDEERTAVCLCPERYHRINATLRWPHANHAVLSFSHNVFCCEREVRGGRLPKDDWVSLVDFLGAVIMFISRVPYIKIKFIFYYSIC